MNIRCENTRNGKTMGKETFARISKFFIELQKNNNSVSSQHSQDMKQLPFALMIKIQLSLK